MPAVKDRTGHSESKIYEGIGKGIFPPPVSLGPTSVAWVAAEIDAYVRFLIAQRDEALAFAAANPSAKIQRRPGRPRRSPWHQQPVCTSEPPATGKDDIQQT
jgi:predicted DNA-binding transcriptional regulator AlpA